MPIMVRLRSLACGSEVSTIGGFALLLLVCTTATAANNADGFLTPRSWDDHAMNRIARQLHLVETRTLNNRLAIMGIQSRVLDSEKKQCNTEDWEKHFAEYSAKLEHIQAELDHVKSENSRLASKVEYLDGIAAAIGNGTVKQSSQEVPTGERPGGKADYKIQVLPLFTAEGTDVKSLWKLGWKSRWNALERALEPFSFGKFWITDSTSELYLANIRKSFDHSFDSGYHDGVLHAMAHVSGGDDGELASKLLALGVNPDLARTDFWRPSHLCGMWARPEMARVLSLCRPDLRAKNEDGRTPLEAARAEYEEGPDDGLFPEQKRRGIRPDVAKIWEEVEKNGFPSIAKLAHLKEWSALQNLCRRRVPTKEEAQEKHDGKNAIEWAEDHQEHEMAAELAYLLAEPSIELREEMAALGLSP